jgi:hypothetical protein
MKKQLFIVILAICSASVLTSCSNDDNPTGQQGEYAGVPLIILDTDIGYKREKERAPTCPQHE